MNSPGHSDNVAEKLDVEKEYDGRGSTAVSTHDGVVINASGHKDQLKRQYGLLGICGLALNIDNAWIALGGSVSISIGKLSKLFKSHGIDGF
jgi:choline transport protein